MILEEAKIHESQEINREMCMDEEHIRCAISLDCSECDPKDSATEEKSKEDLEVDMVMSELSPETGPSHEGRTSANLVDNVLSDLSTLKGPEALGFLDSIETNCSSESKIDSHLNMATTISPSIVSTITPFESQTSVSSAELNTLTNEELHKISFNLEQQNSQLMAMLENCTSPQYSSVGNVSPNNSVSNNNSPNVTLPNDTSPTLLDGVETLLTLPIPSPESVVTLPVMVVPLSPADPPSTTISTVPINDSIMDTQTQIPVGPLSDSVMDTSAQTQAVSVVDSIMNTSTQFNTTSLSPEYDTSSSYNQSFTTSPLYDLNIAQQLNSPQQTTDQLIINDLLSGGLSDSLISDHMLSNNTLPNNTLSNNFVSTEITSNKLIANNQSPVTEIFPSNIQHSMDNTFPSYIDDMQLSLTTSPGKRIESLAPEPLKNLINQEIDTFIFATDRELPSFDLVGFENLLN